MSDANTINIGLMVGRGWTACNYHACIKQCASMTGSPEAEPGNMAKMH